MKRARNEIRCVFGSQRHDHVFEFISYYNRLFKPSHIAIGRDTTHTYILVYNIISNIPVPMLANIHSSSLCKSNLPPRKAERNGPTIRINTMQCSLCRSLFCGVVGFRKAGEIYLLSDPAPVKYSLAHSTIHVYIE